MAWATLQVPTHPNFKAPSPFLERLGRLQEMKSQTPQLSLLHAMLLVTVEVNADFCRLARCFGGLF